MYQKQTTPFVQLQRHDESSYLLLYDECKAVIKPFESISPEITPSNGQYQTASMFCQMSGKLHKITDNGAYSPAVDFLPAV